MELRLERCTIRDWRLDDAPSLAKQQTIGRSGSTLRDLFPHPYTIDNAREFLHEAITEQRRMKFCIDIEGSAAGAIGIHVGEDVHRHVGRIGYWLGEEFWRRGIMTEAISAFVDYCFQTLPLHRICAETYSNNPASARVLEKAGFVLEGRLRNNVVKDGKILDSLLYAKTM